MRWAGGSVFRSAPQASRVSRRATGSTAGVAASAAFAETLESAVKTDTRAREHLRIGQELMAADLVAWDAEHEGAFALRLGSVEPSRVWISGEEVSLSG